MPAHAAAGAQTLLMTTAPDATADDAARIARTVFGLDAAVRPLTSERDRNFHLTAADGCEYVLKVTNSAEEPAVTNLQTAALLHIEQSDGELPVPRVCRALDGRAELPLEVGGQTHVVRLLSYLPGEPLYRTEASPGQRAELGRSLARIGLALADFRHPAARHELLWDIGLAVKLRDRQVHVRDAELRRLATGWLDMVEAEVMPVQRRQRRQVVHNDFNPHNVLVDPATPERVTGVLDFGDIVETALINDVAIAASYHATGERALAQVAEFAAAYHALSPLAPDEIDILFELIALRHVVTITITEWRAQLYPENRAYILRNHARAAEGLTRFAAIDRRSARQALRRACGLE